MANGLSQLYRLFQEVDHFHGLPVQYSVQWLGSWSTQYTYNVDYSN